MTCRAHRMEQALGTSESVQEHLPRKPRQGSKHVPGNMGPHAEAGSGAWITAVVREGTLL
jgi:hypothetical protein